MREQHKKVYGIDMEATSKRIARFIDDSGLSDRELGESMGLTVQSVNKWRHARNLPDIENLYILSTILGVKMDDLIVPKRQLVKASIPISYIRRIVAYLNCFTTSRPTTKNSLIEEIVGVIEWQRY